ncbi:MAG: hypothetical protein MJ252_19865 [archaeon]|nr:hypothetical protein [archaeon]
MGCSTSKESIETEMLILRLTRTQIQEEREAIIKQLEELSGKKVIRAKIPDYLSHSYEEEPKEEEHKAKETKKHSTKTPKRNKSVKKIKEKKKTKKKPTSITANDSQSEEEYEEKV